MIEQEIAILVGQLDGKMDFVINQVNSLDNKIDSLPCVTHANEIETLRAWKKSCNGINDFKSKESYKSGISLRNGIIILALTMLLSTGLTLAISLLTRGA